MLKRELSAHPCEAPQIVRQVKVLCRVGATVGNVIANLQSWARPPQQSKGGPWRPVVGKLVRSSSLSSMLSQADRSWQRLGTKQCLRRELALAAPMPSSSRTPPKLKPLW